MSKSLPTMLVQTTNHQLAGSIIRARRTKKKMSLRSLAVKLDVSAPYLSDMELGKRNWTQERYDKAMSLLK